MVEMDVVIAPRVRVYATTASTALIVDRDTVRKWAAKSVLGVAPVSARPACVSARKDLAPSIAALVRAKRMR